MSWEIIEQQLDIVLTHTNGGSRCLDSPDQTVHCRRPKNVGYTLMWTMSLCCFNSWNWSLTGIFRKNVSVWKKQNLQDNALISKAVICFIQNYLKCFLCPPLAVASKQKSWMKPRVSHTAFKYFKILKSGLWITACIQEVFANKRI